ncbi:TonB-dependent receptor [Porticoccaceae bacterium]|nr:TonB-dependent receptor [Porticoccaceae bacterium]
MNRVNNYPYKKLSFLIASYLTVVPNAVSETTGMLREIIISAQKREQSIQETPIAISALDAIQLETQGIVGLKDLESGAVPSLRIQPIGNTPSTLLITIRGNGPLDVVQVTRESSVAIHLDGIYLGRSQGLASEHADLERIEVLQGPQGTLFGRNATGGSINLISKDPSGEWGLKHTVTSGTFDAYQSATRINFQEFSGISAKVDYRRSTRDGWVKNSAPGQADYNAYDKEGGRLSLDWKKDSLVAEYRGDYSDVDFVQNYFQFHQDSIGLIGVEDGRQTSTRFAISPLKPTNTRQQLHAITMTWLVDDTLKLKSLSSYRELDEHTNNNYGGALYFNGLMADSIIHQHQISEEIQLIGTEARLDWLAGAFYYQEKANETLRNLFTLDSFGFITGNPNTPITPTDIFTTFVPGLGIVSSQVPPRHVQALSRSMAIYGQVTWTPPVLKDRLEVTFGARYNEDRRSGSRQEIGIDTFDIKTDNLDPTLTFNYYWAARTSTYIKWSTAYKAGGANSRATKFSTYSPEEVETIEIGLKSEFWHQRLRINAAIFATDYVDMQIDVSDPDNIALAETINGSQKVEVDGAEIAINIAAAPGLAIGLSYTYLDGHMPAQPNPLANGEPTQFQLAQTPKHAGALSLDYDFAPWSFGALSLHLNATSTDHYAYTSVGGFRLDSYSLINGRIVLENIDLGANYGALKLALWSKNITDEEYIVFAFPLGNPPIAISQVYGTPRTVGLDLTYEF